MYTHLYARIKGTVPQLQNNGLRKDPLYYWTKQLGKISKKTKKTDEDHMAMREAEFKGSLYCLDDEKGGPIYWPSDNIHACIKTAAKMKKLGKVVDTAVVVKSPGGMLHHKGPKTRDALWDAGEEFRLLKPTKRGIMSCRPCFREWEVEFSLIFLEELLNAEDMKQLILDAGRFIGLSDWPRRYGLFEVVEFKNEEVEVHVR